MREYTKLDDSCLILPAENSEAQSVGISPRRRPATPAKSVPEGA